MQIAEECGDPMKRLTICFSVVRTLMRRPAVGLWKWADESDEPVERAVYF
jgi:hypothetical protein